MHCILLPLYFSLPVVHAEVGLPVGLDVTVLLAVLGELLEALEVLLRELNDLEVGLDTLRVDALGEDLDHQLDSQNNQNVPAHPRATW